MKLIVAGGRDFKNRSYMLKTLVGLQVNKLITEEPTLVCGMARGADRTAHTLWSDLDLPIIEMPADWDTYGRSAGYRRNAEMASIADVLVAFWDLKSRGTENMIITMNRLNKPIHVFHY